ncbi:MAG: GNAT family N-acetyltransferase [Clostridiales bacterium]|nr:GNAT family N-acetyltransferase [Clostridiales bacterium]
MNERIFESFPELNTRRLLLRQITQEDDKSLLEVLSDEVTCEYLTHNAVNDIESIKRMITGMQRFFDEKQRIRWGIAQKQDNTLIGHCGFFDIDRTNSCAEISYCIKRELWGHGIMTEAVDAMLRFGFEDYGLNRIVAKVIKDNAGSIKVLQKLGFVQEGLLRESLYKNGQYHDLISFSVLRSEYHV